MSITRTTLCSALLGTFCLCAHGLGSSAAAQERKKGGRDKDASIVKGTLASVDAEKNTITVTLHSFNRATQERTDTDKTIPLAKDAQVQQDAVAAKLADLKKGYPVTIRLAGDNAASVSVDGGTAQGEFLSANLDRNTVTVIAGRDKGKRVFHLLKTTTVTGADGKEILVKDLKPGTRLLLTRSVEDDHTAVRIQTQPAAKGQ
jgi:hypothetical protein